MIRIHLPQAEVKRLEQAFRSAGDRKLRDRLQIVLLANGGRERQDIAADLCVNRRSVQRWLNAYLDRGPGGLLPAKAKGAADEIRRWVIDGPAKQGLDRANWTYEELAGHLGKAHGIKTSRSAMHRFCRKIDIRPYRPTYRYLRGDKDRQAQAREDLDGLKRGRRPAGSSC